MQITSVILKILLPITLGFFFKIIKIFSQNDTTTLRKFIIKVSVPFIIFHNLYTADIAVFSQIIPSVSAFIIVSILFTIVTLLITPLVSNDSALQYSFAFGTQFGNYGYLGWGVMYHFFGNAGFTRSVFYTMFFWPVFLVLGFLMLYFQNTGFTKKDFFKALKENALIPIVASLFGLGFNYLNIIIPKTISLFIETFGSFTIPMILFTIGLSFSVTIKNKMKIVIASLFIRLIGGIGLGYISYICVKLFFPVDSITRNVIILEAVMPTAAMAVYFSNFIQCDEKLLASIITISTLLSLITLPLWYLLITIVLK